MLNLSPAAQAFWGSVIRHLLTGLAGILVAHGYVTKSGADAYTEELVGLALQGAVMVWSNRIVYWQQIRAIVGRAMPCSTHHEVIAKVEELKDAKALPSVFTAPSVTPSLVKPAVLMLALCLGASVVMPACTPRPVTIVTPQGQIAYTADQIVLRVSELQNVAVQMNSSGVLDTGTTRTIMQWSINAAMILKTLPSGWRVTLQQSWTVAKMEIHTTNSAIQSAMAAVDAVLGGI